MPIIILPQPPCRSLADGISVTPKTKVLADAENNKKAPLEVASTTPLLQFSIQIRFSALFYFGYRYGTVGHRS